MKVLDLFSGIGGFSLGLERSGMETIAFCEIEKYPQKILKKHWKNIPIASDIKKLSYNKETQELIYDNEVIYAGSIQLICGGFPCQPFSVAGKQRGKEDDRYLWHEMSRLIKEVQPDWVIGENVTGIIQLALDNVLSDLESQGYEAQSFIIPACAVNAVHRRDRVWIVANTSRNRSKPQCNNFKRRQVQENKKRIVEKNKQTRNGRQRRISETSSVRCAYADTDSERLQGNSKRGSNEKIRSQSKNKQFARLCSSFDFRPIEVPTQSPVRLRDNGLPETVARLKALGNAVVPQIPEMIGRAIMSIENETIKN